MNTELIESNLYSSIDQLIENDLFLLKYAVNERTIAHRLAIYLEHRFTGFHVDCEYNNDLDSENGRKKVYYQTDSSETNDLFEAGAFPDIIIHHRGLNGPNHNILVIEIKKNPS